MPANNQMPSDPGDVQSELKDLRSRLQQIVTEVASIEERMEELEEWQNLQGVHALRETILVVDDSRLVRTLMRGILSGAGYQVAEAESAAEALGYLADHECDLVIVDIFMPEAGGSDLVRDIRLTQKKVDLPVLVCSASRDKIDYQRIGQFGVQGILQKPVKKDDLLAKVKEILRQAAQKQQNAESDFDPSVFNLESALENTGGDRALLRDLIATFVQDSTGLLAAIRKSVVEKDAGGLKQAAHSYKGAAATIGGEAAAKVAFELETMGSEETLVGSRERYKELEAAQHELKEALDVYVKN